MKNRIIKLCLLLTVLAFTAGTVEAQARKKTCTEESCSQRCYHQSQQKYSYRRSSPTTGGYCKASAG
jgi:hypothetical protein